MSRVTRKTTDLRPFRTVVKGPLGPLDVAGASVSFRMRPAVPDQGPTVNAAGAVLQSGVDPAFVNKGLIEYLPIADDVATPGVYRVEWHVTWPGDDTGPHIFPSEGWNDLVLEEAIS